MDGPTVRSKQYEYVAPDGGWGYMICVAAILNLSSMTMFVGCFGMAYQDLFLEYQMDSTEINMVNGLCCLSVAISGFSTSHLLKVMSGRKLALLSAAIFIAGSMGTAFGTTKAMFFINQGVLTGAGVGVLYNLTCSILNEYFVKRRLLFFSIAQAVSGIAGMLAPLLVKYLQEEYNVFGFLLILGGISLHILIGVALMQPVQWHLKKVELVEDSAEEIKLLIGGEKPINDLVTTPTITVRDTENVFETSKESKENINVNNEGGPKGGIMTTLSKYLDLALLKRFVLSNASMGPTFCLMAEATFMLMLPQALYDMKWDQDSVANALMVTSLGDLATRIALIFLSNWLAKIGNQEFFIFGLVLAIVTKLCMLWTENKTLILVYIGLMGVPRCIIFVIPPVILAEVFSPEDYTKAMGMMMLVFGFLNMVLGPAIGAVRDLTNSYPTAFFVISSCYGAVMLLWGIELLYKRNKSRRKQQLLAAEETRKNKLKNKAK